MAVAQRELGPPVKHLLGTKGDTPGQTWWQESLEGLGGAAAFHRQRRGARNSADSQRKE